MIRVESDGFVQLSLSQEQFNYTGHDYNQYRTDKQLRVLFEV